MGGELKWNEDLDATVRCYDCQKYPSSPECGIDCKILFHTVWQIFEETCSDSVKITSEDPSKLGAYAQLLGEYNINQNIPTFNDRKVYKQKGSNYCLYFHCDSWNVMKCSHLQTQTKPDCGRYIGSSDVVVKTCATFPGLTWSKDIQVVQMVKRERYLVITITKFVNHRLMKSNLVALSPRTTLRTILLVRIKRGLWRFL